VSAALHGLFAENIKRRVVAGLDVTTGDSPLDCTFCEFYVPCPDEVGMKDRAVRDRISASAVSQLSAAIGDRPVDLSRVAAYVTPWEPYELRVAVPFASPVEALPPV
jgi:hypothetical protein